MLPADEQEVVWIDGLSIELNQLSPELEPVGICVAINGNKAIVRYKEEFNDKFIAFNPFQIDDDVIDALISNGQPVNVIINTSNWGQLSLTGVSTRQDFVNRFNEFFLSKNNGNIFSVELVELDNFLPAIDASDEKDGDSYRNRVIIYSNKSNFDDSEIIIGTYTCHSACINHIDGIDINNIAFFNNSFDNFDNNDFGVYCVCKYTLFDLLNNEETGLPTPDAPLDSINYFVTKNDFDTNENCQILRDNFANYDDYLDSLLVKFPCGASGLFEKQSGKENTYKLANYKYSRLDVDQEYLYPAAHKAASINVNGPKLTAGNWWVPSPAEVAQMMSDITYDTSFWDSKPDIVNRVIDKIRKVDTNWTYLLALASRWTSFRINNEHHLIYFYLMMSCILSEYSTEELFVSPITIYEF